MTNKYFGELCTKHPELNGLRYSNRHCIVCTIDESRKRRLEHPEIELNNQRKRRQANPEQNRNSMRKWIAKNPELFRERTCAYAKANPESVREHKRKWRFENPGKINAKTARRAAAKLQATPVWANEFIITEAYALAKLREKVCGGKWHVDHIVPLKSQLVCGLHVETNLRVIPALENMKKSNRFWPGMFVESGSEAVVNLDSAKKWATK